MPHLGRGLAGWAVFLGGALAAGGCARESDGSGASGRGETVREEPPAPRFATRRERRVHAKPEWVLAGDLDGDGHDECVAATISPGELLVWRGGPRGLEPEPRAIPVGGYPLRPTTLRDARGTTLLAVASRETRRLELFELGPWLRSAPGSEAAPPARVTLELPSIPRAIAAGDLGADGDAELVVAGDGRRLTVVGADGGLRELAIEAELPRCLLVAAGGDGLWIGSQDRRALDFLPFEGGELRPAARAVELGGIPRALAQADLDGDGDLELIAAGGDGEVWVFGFGDARGPGAWLAGELPQPLAWSTEAVPIDLEVEDLDGDARPELVLVHAAALTWSVWSDFGPSGPARVVTGYAGQTPLDGALGDLDGDGLLDLAVANRDSQVVSLCAGADGAFVRPARAAVGGFPNAIAVGDLDGDARPDAVVLCSKDDRFTVLSNRGGELVPAGSVPAGPSPRAPRLADLDGDGRDELALLAMDAAGARVVAFARDPDGGFERAFELPAGRSARDLLAVDLDADGRLELVVAADEADRLLWFERGEGTEYRAPRELELASGPCALAAIELDGDAAPELAVALGGPGGGTGVALFDALEGDGGLELVLLARIGLDGAPSDLVARDLDGDGREDLALVASERPGSEQGVLLVLLREPAPGTGFVARAPLPTALVPRHLAAGDLDGDDRDDLAAACQLGHVVDCWLARGAAGPSFRMERLDGLGAGVGCFDLAVTDVDGDGRPDLVVVDAHADSVSTILQRPPLAR